MAFDRQERALREFKQIMEDLVNLLRTSARVELVYMCWVNHARQQFVWETNSTNLPNVMFKDRIAFEQHFLNDYKNIDQIKQLRVGDDVPKAKLMHYFKYVSAQSIVLVPFINRGETVALTVLESETPIDLQKINMQIHSYNNAIVNVLDTYLEVVDLNEQQHEWEDYEKSIKVLDYRLNRVELLVRLLDEMQKCIPTGGVSLVCPGMDSWNHVLSSKLSKNAPLLGLKMEEKSIANEAADRGEPVFDMHFNNNPKRISNRERLTEGASYAIPLLVNDRRQGILVAYDNDPLNFKESTKHKLANLVRIAALSIQSVVKKGVEHEDLMTSQFGAFMPEIWEAAIDNELSKLKTGRHPYSTWFGLVTPEDISGLRTRFRLEDLQRIQRDFVSFLNPSKYGIAGFIGYHSDYIYSFVIQSGTDEGVVEWMEKIKTKLAHGLRLSNGHNLTVAFKAGFTKLSEKDSNSYQVLNKAKQALNEVVKNDKSTLVEI